MKTLLAAGRTHLLIGALCLIFVPTLKAQSYIQPVWTQLQSGYTVAHEQQSYDMSNYVLGLLNSGDSDSWSLNFEVGRQYIITGACDNDCSDLDIKIMRSGGEILARDAETDDRPVVGFVPTASGVYTVEITMYSCSTSACGFGFGVLYK